MQRSVDISEGGDGPFDSEVLGAYLVVGDEGRILRISSDPGGHHLWPTAADTERTRADAERADKERLLARIAELEADPARRKW